MKFTVHASRSVIKRQAVKFTVEAKTNREAIKIVKEQLEKTNLKDRLHEEKNQFTNDIERVKINYSAVGYIKELDSKNELVKEKID